MSVTKVLGPIFTGIDLEGGPGAPRQLPPLLAVALPLPLLHYAFAPFTLLELNPRMENINHARCQLESAQHPKKIMP